MSIFEKSMIRVYGMKKMPLSIKNEKKMDKENKNLTKSELWKREIQRQSSNFFMHALMDIPMKWSFFKCGPEEGSGYHKKCS